MCLAYALTSGNIYPNVNQATDIISIATTILCVGTMAAGMLAAAVRGAGRRFLVAGNLLLGLGLAGLLVPWLAHVPSDLVGTDPTGMRGIARTAGWLILVYAILHQDVLGLGLKPRTVNRGAIAAAALAALFIVAQVMQNFLSAQYGLLTGGVIAGTVLFAANPVQRAIERATEGSPARPGRMATQEEAYKAAVRLALRGGITRAEEVELARIADAHGIAGVRALELREEVERQAEAS
jgi:hypothetical protein